MNKFRRVMILILLSELLLFFGANFYVGYGDSKSGKNAGAGAYRVEIQRAQKDMEAFAAEITDQESDVSESTGGTPVLSEGGNTRITALPQERLDEIAGDYSLILGIRPFDVEELVNEEYRVEKVGGVLYRFVYRTGGNNSVAKSMNVVFAMVFLLTMLVLVYIQRKILAPFNRMTGVTEDLARGNLAMPLSQEKSGYFKSFLWSIDMLREKLTDDRTREMALQKEKKTIVLSLAHDIKTPLSAIDLYVKALSENLYDTGEKKEAALKGIEKNADEIKKYVNEIVTASREDFLDLSVKIGEIYLSEVLKPVTKYYADKLNLLSINFSIDVYQDVLLSCDGSRLMEAMQNCMENAIKYGDGREIHIGIEEEENCKLITIENSGCNLSAEEEDSIFDSFYRGSNSQGIQGSGLGLYICRELLRAMGGEAYARIGEDLFRVTLVVPMV